MKSKKANVMWYLISILIAIITFFIYVSFFTGVTNSISTQAQDFACRSLISLKDTSVGQIGEFFSLIHEKCYVDNIKIKDNTKDKVFKQIGNEMSRCWYRYGEGKYDFMSKWDTQGNWCFVCGDLTFKNKGNVYSYNDFVNWSANNKFKPNGGKEQTYYNYISMKYSDAKTNQLLDVKSELMSLLNEKDSSMKNLLFVLSNQYEHVQDLRAKQIDTNENVYVVYRFDRLDSSTSDKMTNALLGTGASMVGAILAGAILENIIWAGATGVVCAGSVLTAGLLTPVCAILGAKTAEKVVESTIDTTKTVSKTKKIVEIINKLTDMVKVSGKGAREVKELDNMVDLVGDVKGITNIAGKLRKAGKVKTADELDEIVLGMNKLGINSIDEINAKKLDTIAKRKNLQEIVYKAIDSNLISNPGIRKTAEKETGYSKQIAEFEKLQNKVKGIKIDKNLLTEKETGTVKSFLKSFVVLGAGAAGGYAGYNIKNNNNQYVDLMTQEQYYRLCGTQSFGQKK